jgi:hypothetical protein
MTSPDDALWVTVEVSAGTVEVATVQVCQNVRWSVEVGDTLYTGHFC